MTAIPREAIEAARLRLKRKVAAMLIAALAEDGGALVQIDARLGKRPGYPERFIHRLIRGTTDDLNTISDLCLAMDCEPQFSIHRLPPQPQPEQVEATA